MGGIHFIRQDEHANSSGHAARSPPVMLFGEMVKLVDQSDRLSGPALRPLYQSGDRKCRDKNLKIFDITGQSDQPFLDCGGLIASAAMKQNLRLSKQHGHFHLRIVVGPTPAQQIPCRPNDLFPLPEIEQHSQGFGLGVRQRCHQTTTIGKLYVVFVHLQSRDYADHQPRVFGQEAIRDRRVAPKPKTQAISYCPEQVF